MDTKYDELSSRVSAMLAGGENQEVEFKESLSGLQSDHLVAFANSTHGGTMLIGVREYQTEEGHQRGEIIGCPVGDVEKLSIINRAESCIPSVELEIVVENAAQLPFFRIEIPTGNDPPYCTAGGTYKIRGNARTNALTPARLLRLFMDNESQEFLERFRNATVALEAGLFTTENKITRELEGLFGNLVALQRVIEEVFGSAEEAASLADHSTQLTHDTQAMVLELNRRLTTLEKQTLPRLEQKLDFLLRKRH
ncbi:MAG: ATP-binding protein [Anaerolineae bacterium]|nr:ATP-binding protein [Anaerolineae bacterium]